jgi:putative ABC transport system permease protein
MENFWRDVRLSFRSFARNPGFTAVALLSLALGIGANTAIFTLINAVFLNPLAVKDPKELVAIFTIDANNPGQFSNLNPLSYRNYKDYRDDNAVFAGVTGYTFPFVASLMREGEATRIFAQLASGNYFEVLGVHPAQGRFFLPEEDGAPGAHPVAVLSHRFWSRNFGGDPSVVGQTLRINGLVYTVVGIAPDGFQGVSAIFGPDVWIPATMYAQLLPAQFRDFFDERRALFFNVAARLKPGIGSARAEAELKTIASRLEKEYPRDNAGRTVTLRPLTEATIFPGLRELLLRGGIVLMSIVGLVLLVACSNVANLLLARGAARRKEVAIRLSLGAGRRRLIRQLMTESVLLALMGGALGLLVAHWGRSFIVSFPLPFVGQDAFDLRLDGRVLGFTLMVSVLTGVLFGLVPSLQAARPDVVGDLKQETVGLGGTRRLPSLRNALVVAQVSLSVVALVAAGLFLRSLGSAKDLDPGFEAKRLALLTLSPGEKGYDQARTEQFYDRVLERARSLPGVRSASLATNLPLFGGFARSVFLEGQPQEKGKGILVNTNNVDPGYFQTLGVALLRGRDFTEADRAETRPVAIVNETMAERFWPNQEAVGRRFQFYGDAEGFYREVVGVVKTSNYATIGEQPQSCAFVPLRQNFADAVSLHVRSEGDPAPVLGAVQNEIRLLDREMPLTNVQTVGQLVDQSLWAPKLGAGLLAVLGLLALVLASVGLYGVMSYWVARSQREIGIRMAIGAGRSEVLSLVFKRAMTLVVVGVGLGLAASLAVSRLISTLLYGSARDPVTFVGVPLLLATVALVAAAIPAFRASRVDPVVALRYQ